MRSIKFVTRNVRLYNKSYGVYAEGTPLEDIFKLLLKEYGKEEILCDLEFHITPKENTVLVDVGNKKYASLADFKEDIDEQEAEKTDPESKWGVILQESNS